MRVIRSLMSATVASVVLLSDLSAQGGRGTISGKVVDSTSQAALSSATVQILGTARGALTRADGGFTLTDIPVGAQRVRVARIGYAPQIKDVTVSAGATVTLQFSLNAVAASRCSSHGLQP